METGATFLQQAVGGPASRAASASDQQRPTDGWSVALGQILRSLMGVPGAARPALLEVHGPTHCAVTSSCAPSCSCPPSVLLLLLLIRSLLLTRLTLSFAPAISVSPCTNGLTSRGHLRHSWVSALASVGCNPSSSCLLRQRVTRSSGHKVQHTCQPPPPEKAPLLAGAAPPCAPRSGCSLPQCLSATAQWPSV